ncbi:MAG: hypothetical protein HOV81_24765 [Kofleriaceae bacterium]|nr:hypothetical protein [Kofleriaceae bacterium]
MWRPLLALVALAACSDRYGAYFVVDGHDQIEIDRVEFYFGQKTGTMVPVPPGHTATEPEPGLLLRRLVADSDVVTLPATAGAYTYFVPPAEDNAKLGDYLLVVASKGDVPVGIAELFDFTVPTDDVVYKYELPLVDYAAQSVELWGRPTSDCVRWKRDRGSRPELVAVARGNDVDCDAFVDRDDPAVDCEPLRYCDGTGNAGCIGAAACVTLDDGCRIGTCQNKDGQQSSCAPTTCAVDQACAECDLDAPTRELLDCVLLAVGTHLDYPVTVQPSQALCSEPYKVRLELPPNVLCTNPRIEASVNWLPGETFGYQIASGLDNHCLLTLTPPTPGAKFEGIPHVMVSIDSPAGPTARLTFIFGLSTRVDACSTDQTIVIDPTSVSCTP